MRRKVVNMEVTATAYRINSCHYKNGRVPATGFPSPKEVVEELIRWGKGTSAIENTFTYATGLRTTSKQTYFVDGYFDAASDEAVVVLWKEVNSNKGDIYGLPRSDQPGAAGEVQKNTFDIKKYIPGFPIYFWFRFHDNSLIALLFDHSERGKSNLENYVDGFMRHRAGKWVAVTKDQVGEKDLVNSVHGYAPDGDVKNVVLNVQPRVSFSILKSGNTLPLLIENLDKITRLRRTEKFLMASDAGEEKTSAERFKEAKVFKYGIFQGLGSRTRSYTSVRYKSEISWRPTKEEVVDLHEKALEAFENGDLIGLSAVTNESQSISFLGNAVREEVDLEFSKSYTGFIDAEDLYQAVNKKRKSLP